MNDTDVANDAVDNLIKLMKDTFGGQYVSYYDGDPISIPKESLPCIIVDTPEANVRTDATSTDRLRSSLRIKLVRNKQDDFGASDDVDMTERTLRRHIQARDPISRQYIPGTVLHALRTHVTLYQTTISQEVDIQYLLNPRPGGIVTSEALISIITTERIIRPPQVAT